MGQLSKPIWLMDASGKFLFVMRNYRLDVTAIRDFYTRVEKNGNAIIC